MTEQNHAAVRSRRNAPVAIHGLAEDESFANHFWARARKSSVDRCWFWTGARLKRSGYGLVYVHGRARRAHRVAYSLSHGGLEAGPYILHTCDNPPCVNPAHLVGGSQLLNMIDASRKGRLRAKLTAAQALQVRIRRAAGEPLDQIAADVGVDRVHVFHIARGSRRPHLAMPKPADFAARVQRYREEAARRGIRLIEPREPVHQVRALALMATGHSYTKAARALGVSRGRIWNVLHPGTKRPSRRAVIDPAAPAPNTIAPTPSPLELTDAELLALLRRRGGLRPAA